jgi:hypothetical protein
VIDNPCSPASDERLLHTAPITLGVTDGRGVNQRADSPGRASRARSSAAQASVSAHATNSPQELVLCLNGNSPPPPFYEGSRGEFYTLPLCSGPIQSSCIFQGTKHLINNMLDRAIHGGWQAIGGCDFASSLEPRMVSKLGSLLFTA